MLAALTALGPFSLQTMAPALPTLSKIFERPEATVQLLISLSMWALAASAVVYGPLADRYGRRPILLGGLAMAGGGAAIAALSTSFELLLFGRLLQAAGAGAGMVLSRAVARDLYSLDKVTVLLGRITAIMVVAPMLAPLVGGVLLDQIGWRSVFGAAFVVAVALFFMVQFMLPESLREPAPELRIRPILSDFGRLLRSRQFMANATYSSASFAAFFLFVGSAPYVMERAYGYNATQYGALFVFVAGAYSLANFASASISRPIGPRRAVQFGVMISTLGSSFAALLIGVLWESPFVLTAGAAIGALGSGLAMPHSIAGAVEAAPDRAGSASGLLTVIQFVAAGLAAQGATFISTESGAPLSLAMAITSLVGGIGFAFLSPPRA
ncbi:MAG: multidrug effflux MFS transporter [Neomegalonema sp.]|nr:multidrug effflux MFS transporter [Neomegalonema sp.]